MRIIVTFKCVFCRKEFCKNIQEGQDYIHPNDDRDCKHVFRVEKIEVIKDEG